jgi:dienelactone hydrolase
MRQMTFQEVTEQLIQLYSQGKYAEAEQMIRQQADRFSEQAARTTYWRMCLLSLSGRPDDVMTVFRQGLDSGLWWRNDVFNDGDLDPVRDLPEFQHMVAESQKKYEEGRASIERDYAVLVPGEPAAGPYPVVIALHGRNGNKESNRAEWETARHKGWLVILTQSTQPLFPGSYCWDDPAQAMNDLRFYHDEVSRDYSLDPQRIVIAGFSQGSGMAIYAALKGNLAVRGFIGIGTWWADASELAGERKDIRGYFITGEKDHTIDRAREIHNVLRTNNVQFIEEVQADIGHEFPADFGSSFDKAIDFIFKEQE